MDEVVKAEFDRLRDEDKRQNARIEKLENDVTSIHGIALSVEKLALNMQNMLEEQKKQGARLEKLEGEPAEAWSNAKKTVFNALLGAFASALGIGLVWLLTKGI